VRMLTRISDLSERTCAGRSDLLVPLHVFILRARLSCYEQAHSGAATATRGRRTEVACD